MNLVHILEVLGGLKGLNKAMQKQAMTDFFCPSNGKWYTEKYWNHHAETSSLTGYSLREIMFSTPKDATHKHGSYLCKIDFLERVCRWNPNVGRWECEGWLPKDELEPLD